jgi:hypothetical protein
MEDFMGDSADPEVEGEKPASAAQDAEAVRLGRFLPLGMILGAVAGVLAGALTRRWGICIPVGVALGILLAGTLPVFLRRRS